MFKQLLSDKRLFYGLVGVIVFLGVCLLYQQIVSRQTARAPQRTQEIVEEHQTPTPVARVT